MMKTTETAALKPLSPFDLLAATSKAHVLALGSLKYRVVDGRCPNCRTVLLGEVVEVEESELIRDGEQGADRLYPKVPACPGCFALFTVDGGTLYVGEPSGCSGCGSPLRLSDATHVVDPTEYYCNACHAEECEGRCEDCQEKLAGEGR